MREKNVRAENIAYFNIYKNCTKISEAMVLLALNPINIYILENYESFSSSICKKKQWIIINL